MVKRKSQKSKTGMLWIMGIVVVILAFGITAISVSDSGKLPVDNEGNPVGVCGGDVTPDLLVKAYDANNVGTAITEAGIYREVGTISFSTFTPGTDLADVLTYGKTYEFYPGITTSDFLDHAYGERFEYTVKCVADSTKEIPMYNDEIETSLSATFYNEDANAAAITVLAADTPVVSIKLRAGADEVFGNPNLANPNVLVLRLNSSEWDTPLKVMLDSVELAKVSSLQRLDGASGYNDYFYALPAITDEKIEVMLYLDADNTNAPSVDGTAYIYAGGYFLNSDTGMIETGVETQEGNAVATDAADSVALDFTA